MNNTARTGLLRKQEALEIADQMEGSGRQKRQARKHTERRSDVALIQRYRLL